MIKTIVDETGMHEVEMSEEEIALTPGMNGLTADQIWEAIKAERDRRQSAGVKVGSHWFHSDEKSRIQQIGLVMLGANIPPGKEWKTMSGVFVPLSQQLAGGIFAASAAADMAIFAFAEALKAQVFAAEDPNTVDITVGWPQTYEESIA